MKAVIDTNSLLALVRYYIPFDKQGVLFGFFKQKIQKSEIIIIDGVLEECEYISKGIVITTLNYLKDGTFVPVNTNSIYAPAPTRFLNMLENQFVNKAIKQLRKITDDEFDNQKDEFLKNADMRQIIFA